MKANMTSAKKCRHHHALLKLAAGNCKKVELCKLQRKGSEENPGQKKLHLKRRGEIKERKGRWGRKGNRSETKFLSAAKSQSHLLTFQEGKALEKVSECGKEGVKF